MNSIVRQVFFLAVAITLFFSVPGTALSQKSGVQHWKSSDIIGTVGLITALNQQSGKWYPLGTGVLVDVDSTWPHLFFLTNRHLFVGKDTLQIRLRSYETKGQHTVTKQLFLNLSRQSPAFVPTTEDSDFVAILVNRTSGKGIISVERSSIAYSTSLKYGDNVEFYGYPLYTSFGLHKNVFNLPLLRSGVLSYFAPDASVPNLLPSMFLVDGVSFGGNSGSPVFLKRIEITDSSKILVSRKFIGIVTGHYPLWGEIKIEQKLIAEQLTLTDSMDIEQFIENYKFKYKQNSDLVIVVSTDILLPFIAKHYLQYLKTERNNLDIDSQVTK